MTGWMARHWRLAVLWALSLVVVGAASSTAQTGRPGRGLADVPLVTAAPMVVSGDDVGFRVERTVNGMPVGRIVVRIDGRWIDATTSAPR